jgi:hypothetical protein
MRRSAALAAHDAGWHPVKIPKGKKFPPETGRTGYKGRNRVRGELVGEDWSDSSLAVRMPPDVIGIDLDVYNGGDLGPHEAEYGPLPMTVMSTARTDGSGIRFFRVPVGTMLTTAIPPGIEIVQYFHRYAVVAPSTNPKVDAPYRWIDQASGEILDGPPDVDDLPDLPWSWIEGLAKSGGGKLSDRAATPDELLEFLDAHTETLLSAALKGPQAELHAVKIGGRHDTLVKAACWMMREARAGVYPAGDAMALLDQWWSTFDDKDSAEFVSALSWAVAEATATSEERIAEIRQKRLASFEEWLQRQRAAQRQATAEWISKGMAAS